jgi:hypothetical protein
VFDYVVSASDGSASSLAVTGFVPHGSVVADIAGNIADVSHVIAAVLFPLTTSHRRTCLLHSTLEPDGSGSL